MMVSALILLMTTHVAVNLGGTGKDAKLMKMSAGTIHVIEEHVKMKFPSLFAIVLLGGAEQPAIEKSMSVMPTLVNMEGDALTKSEPTGVSALLVLLVSIVKPTLTTVRITPAGMEEPV